jgi:hypothetical protein
MNGVHLINYQIHNLCVEDPDPDPDPGAQTYIFQS